jgi:hypothetical protein
MQSCTHKCIYVVAIFLGSAYMIPSPPKRETNRFWDQDKPHLCDFLTEDSSACSSLQVSINLLVFALLYQFELGSHFSVSTHTCIEQNISEPSCEYLVASLLLQGWRPRNCV